MDAMLPDVEGGKRFYGELFGWTFDEGAGAEYGHYVQANLGGEPVAALAPKPDGRMPTAWTVHLATPDAAALAGRIRDAGGQLITGPVEVGPFGTMALAADPEGAVFGLWQAGTHQGFGRQREPGSFCWTELYARSKDTVDPFYEGVFGYGGQDLDSLGEDFRTWSPAGAEPGPETAIGGRALLGGRFPAEMPPHFLNYFLVPDCDAAVATALRLGGRVRDEPENTPYGRFSVLVDNQGAGFAVLQEPDQG
ncbi:putative 27 kDa antigen Cfp30B [Streptomyces aurantiacus JA 4570]|uniref:Putative 27 kDa antigen Cfp30B n=1 Tax=Streptomyces aurantiacus JA 4570 TaxID=1286094 RepID=S3ZSI7_9ACTN|nr:putative 27 kDa antigen Cfp30B [Streptomyces aurantiacus JA 4570]